MNVGDEYKLKTGTMVIKEIHHEGLVVVRFKGGFVSVTTKREILNGTVINYHEKKHYNMGYLGAPVKCESIRRKWMKVLYNCYKKKDGSIVYHDWHNLSNFHEWVIANADTSKDFTVTRANGTKLYSPQTCSIEYS